MHHKMLALVAGAAMSALMLALDTVLARDGLRRGVRGVAIGAYRSATLRSWRVVGCCAALGWNPYHRFGNGWGAGAPHRTYCYRWICLPTFTGIVTRPRPNSRVTSRHKRSRDPQRRTCRVIGIELTCRASPHAKLA